MKYRAALVLVVLVLVVLVSVSASARDEGIVINEVNQLPQWTREIFITPSFECDDICGWETWGSSESQIECGTGMAATGNCNLRQGTVGGLDYAEQFFDLGGYDTSVVYLQICYYILTEEPAPAYHDKVVFSVRDQLDRTSYIMTLHDADSGFSGYRCELFEMMGYGQSEYTFQIGSLNNGQYLTEFRVDDVSWRVEIEPEQIFMPYITRETTCYNVGLVGCVEE